MNIQREVLRQSEQRAQGLAAAAVPPRRRQKPSKRGAASPDRDAAEFERLIRAVTATPPLRVPPPIVGLADRPRVARDTRSGHLSFGGAKPTSTELERSIGTNDLVDEFYLERALVAASPVCRIVVRSGAGQERGYATGFMISPRLLLTNWHVFRSQDEAVNGIAEFNYRLGISGDPLPSFRFLLRPDQCYRANEALDYAIVAVSPSSTDGARSLDTFGYHRLVPDEHKIEEGEWITIIQHPGGAHRQFSIRENQLIEKQTTFLWYASDTAQGSSGAPAFNDSFQVVALHHSGKAKREGDLYVLKDGSLVASIDGLDDSKVVWEANEGLRVSVLCADLAAQLAGPNPFMQELGTAISGQGDIMTKAIGGGGEATTNGNGRPGQVASPGGYVLDGARAATVQMYIQHVTIQAINVGAPVAPALSIAPPQPLDGAGAVEKMVAPKIDTHYGNRKGYDEGFLGVLVPMPKATKLNQVAKMDDGKHIIPYQHFSVVVHKERRLALVTASNVNAAKKAKQPEPGDYTRKGLSGLGENDIEKWVTDPRIAEQHQLPDVFFTKDRQSFDKGHIVRREDVCFGTSRTMVVRANGDTYHTTNCSPQVQGFNQSGHNGLWGQLENHVLKQAATEKYCLFAGPVLDADDEVFDGVDERGPVHIKIPRRFWKVIVARKGNELQSFAFVLEQDLSEVPMREEEFKVTATWRPHMKRITKLAAMLPGVQFAKAIVAADQFDEAGGHELAKAAEIARG